MPCNGTITFVVNDLDTGKRLDSIVASYKSCCSRSLAASLIRKGIIRVGQSQKKPGYRVCAGETVTGFIPSPKPVSFKPEPIPLDILFEDEHIVVVNKQAGIVVHPAPGNYSGTLVNGLLFHCADLEGIGGELRPGIVHRLDKDTSGTLVVAKNHPAHLNLSAQFKSRTVIKKYLAVVFGEMKNTSGSINLPIGRHLSDRKKMSIHSHKTRTAETKWKIIEQYKGVTLLELNLKTGRTHQIRVHCSAINHPVVGDPVYCSKKKINELSKHPEILPFVKPISRQMLHAWRLDFIHPASNNPVSFESPLPEDMKNLIDGIRSIVSSN